MNNYLEKKFGVIPKGIWLPERVWEQSLVRYFAKFGIKYTIVDDFHFKTSGLRDEDLVGYFFTEDIGNLFYVFPLKEDLRYSIPFKEPEWTINYLLHKLTAEGDRIIVYADDGEKFGLWPRTKRRVWDEGWLKKFLELLEKNYPAINTITFSDALKEIKPLGKIFLPTCSYREMGEWSLFKQGHDAYQTSKQILSYSGKFDELKHTIPGGYWRNYIAKYKKVELMYGRMLSISKKVNSLDKNSSAFKQAQLELYKAQCNCGYWHGIFGGFYMPHLRCSIFNHLIKAENIAEAVQSTKEPYIQNVDINCDGHNEIRLFNKELNIFVAPHLGGRILEIDLRRKNTNILAVLSRMEEYYHKDTKKAIYYKELDIAKSIHDVILTKVKDIQNYIFYDNYEKDSFIEHFFLQDISLDALEKGEALDLSDFYSCPYEYTTENGKDNVTLAMRKSGYIRHFDNAPTPIEINKKIVLGKENAFSLDYTMKNLSERTINVVFAVEFNLGLFGPERQPAFIHKGDNLAIFLLTERDKIDVDRNIYIKNPSQGIDIGFEFSKPCSVFFYPINTVSLSEGGFELTYQGSSFIFAKPLNLPSQKASQLHIKIAIT